MPRRSPSPTHWFGVSQELQSQSVDSCEIHVLHNHRLSSPPSVQNVDSPPDTNSELGPGGKAALEAKRAARKQAEKDARERQKRIDALEAEKLSETEKLQSEAQEGRDLAHKASEKLRRANLLSALSEAGLVGPRARATARLVDGVEFDAEDEPTNLKDRIEAAKAEFGEDMFAGATSVPVANNGGPGPAPNLHQGARDATPAVDEDEQFAAFMRQNFPQSAAPAGQS
jgi:hypothetical protein